MNMRALWRYVMTGLELTGLSYLPAWPPGVPPTLSALPSYQPDPPDEPAEPGRGPVPAGPDGAPAPTALPPGHPERLVPPVAASAVELALWQQLSRTRWPGPE